MRSTVPPKLTARALLGSSVFTSPALRRKVPPFTKVVPLTNWRAFRFSTPPRLLVMPAEPMKPLVTARACPAAT